MFDGLAAVAWADNPIYIKKDSDRIGKQHPRGFGAATYVDKVFGTRLVSELKTPERRVLEVSTSRLLQNRATLARLGGV